MSLKMEAFFDLMLYYSQQIESGNNGLWFKAIDRWKQLSPENIKELTKRRPNFKEELEHAHDQIQDAMEPVNEVICVIEEILAEREKQAA